MKHEEKLYWFDLIRGLSALAVLLGHLRALVFNDYQDNPNLGALGKAFYFVTGFGHQAVVIFFVLSGYFIIRSIHESAEAHKWSPQLYFFNRVSRLWIVLIPALLATLVWDNLGLSFFPESIVYANVIPTLPGINPAGKLGLLTFLGNTFFLQTILVDTYGSNGALWSLANEFWYYMAFPLLYFSFKPYYKKTIRLLLFVCAVLLLYFSGWGIATYFLIWLMGGVTYVLARSNFILLQQMYFRVILFLIFLGILFCIRFNLFNNILNDFSLGAITSVWLSSVIFADMQTNALKKCAVFLSNMSYSVYLFHLSFAVLLSAAFFPQRISYSLHNLVLYFGLLVIILFYCRIFFALFERNTTKFKKMLLAVV